MNRTTRSIISAFVMGACLLQIASSRAQTCGNWPAWEGFRKRFVNDSGRVIDPSTSTSTSESQSYGLFFSLVADDRDGFARILKWTEDNLAEGDLTARLPAWQWGKRNDGSWGVLDSNAASDSDLWIAYSLAEAGRLWKVQKYSAMAQLLAERVLREETVTISGLGRTLLPGPKGFQPQPGQYRLNPSYVPIQLMRRFAALYPQKEWKQMMTSSIDVTVRSSPRGYAPDWVLFKADGGFMPDTDTKAVGSYNAIRVYLWAGMLATEDPARSVLLKRFAPMAQFVTKNGTPPLETATRDGNASGTGPAGFSAALLPFLVASKLPEAQRQQRMRIDAKGTLDRNDNYYEQALTLFGLGWTEGQYRFSSDGSLQPHWKCARN